MDKNRQIVWELFKGRCFLCGRQGSDVHELEPKSRGGDWARIENRVVVCRECHSMIHRMGVSESFLEQLKEKRRNFLIRIGVNDHTGELQTQG
jgi:5-methylcytosine-specific restriction endonuclease McrA